LLAQVALEILATSGDDFGLALPGQFGVDRIAASNRRLPAL
jgi:hypothetical protein